MKKLLFLPIFLFGFSTYPDFSLCYQKYKNYSIIPISKHYSITAIPQKKYIKYDSKLGLFLIKANNKYYLHFKKAHIGIWLASITKKSIYSGNYASYQTTLYKPAQFSTKTIAGSIMSDIFCNPIGIGVKNGFLSKTFIKKFITSKPPISQPLKYMGIILNKNLTITKILPNSIANKYYLQIGDKIIKLNQKKVFTKSDIQNILNSTKNVTITVQQNGYDFTFKGY